MKGMNANQIITDFLRMLENITRQPVVPYHKIELADAI